NGDIPRRAAIRAVRATRSRRSGRCGAVAPLPVRDPTADLSDHVLQHGAGDHRDAAGVRSVVPDDARWAQLRDLVLHAAPLPGGLSRFRYGLCLRPCGDPLHHHSGADLHPAPTLQSVGLLRRRSAQQLASRRRGSRIDARIDHKPPQGGAIAMSAGNTAVIQTPARARTGLPLWDKFRRNVVWYSLVTLLSVLFMGPFVWALSSSLKTPAELYLFPPTLFPKSLQIA